MLSNSLRPRSLVVIPFAGLALLGLVALPACEALPPEKPDPVAAVGPIADFARLVGGEWQVTFANGTRGVHVWRWGPGKHSLVRATHGLGGTSHAWAGDVLYWHPLSQQVRMLSLHEEIPAVGRGVGEGTIAFAGETAIGSLDLMQPRGLRKLGTRWTFSGPDHYRDELLEDTGSGLAPLAEWEYSRVPARTAAVATPAPTATEPSGTLRAFTPLLDHLWQARRGADGVAGSDRAPARSSQVTFAWIPSFEVIAARSESVATAADAPTQLLEAWVYRPITPGPPRCLVLTHRGDVYDGEVGELASGGIRLVLNGCEDGRAAQREVHLELERDGTLRQRVWSTAGSDRTLVLDVPFRSAGQQRD